jgi:hypothetical protein
VSCAVRLFLPAFAGLFRHQLPAILTACRRIVTYKSVKAC